ncbi:M protein [Mundri virus]|uniref:M protein n=1 Tax=Mundri virus TaxID=2913478 RepID=UPI0024820AE6|nr:M protein [Mundri virus]UJY53551.1 M protein [Mundri virus]
MLAKWKPKKSLEPSSNKEINSYFLPSCPDYDGDLFGSIPSKDETPSVESFSFVVKASLVVSSNQPIRELRPLMLHMECFQDVIELTMAKKSLCGAVLSLLCTHLSVNPAASKSGLYSYSSFIESAIQFSGSTGFRYPKDSFEETVTLNSREQGLSMNSKCKMTFTRTRRTGQDFHSLYHSPMSNGDPPPSLEDTLSHLGMSDQHTDGSLRLNMYS